MKEDNVYLDLSVSLSIKPKDLEYYNTESEEIISYTEYLKLEKKEKDMYILNSIKDLINKSNIEEVYNIYLNEV